jgi:hypothetical protein
VVKQWGDIFFINKTTGGFRNNQTLMAIIDKNLQEYPDHYDINQRWDLSTIFSIEGVVNVNEVSGFTADAIEHEYNTYWSDGKHPGTNKKIQMSLPKGELTWLQLWFAIDKLSKISGDDAHIYIEEITYSKTNPNTLVVFMGS